MLQRTCHPNGVVSYQSPGLAAVGLIHAFSTRVGGVSAGPYTALNLGHPGGDQQDAAANLLENYRRLGEACGAGDMPRAWVRQVHGREIVRLEREPAGEYGETLAAELGDRFSGQLAADGLVSLVPGVLLTVRTADCAPILLASPDGRIVAAVHAGWRGVVADVIAEAVRAMCESGTAVEQVVAAIGPTISAEHFEVGPEVAEAFNQAGLAPAVSAPAGRKPHIDLPLAVRLRLERTGVRRIDVSDRCTYRDAEEFFSHRRDRGLTGRMAAVIAARD